MKKILLLIFVVLIVSCTANKKNESAVATFSKDSVMQSIMYSNIDTINGYWKINISKDEAIKKGVSEKVYTVFENSVKNVNSQIDSIKKVDPKARIGYNFPKKGNK